MGLWTGGLLTLVLSSLLFVSALFHTTHTYGVSGIELLRRGIRAITKRFNIKLNARELKKEE